GIVYDGGNTNSFQILEQNWNGWANKKPSLRWDNYYGLTHFIVPPVAKEIEEPKKDAKSAPKQSVKENSSIKVNTNHIKGWTMTK
ncbi:N-acetylmuramoyl-L-alanine amidase, partial [Staphylococcus epidermidis]